MSKYPVKFAVKYPNRDLDRLSTFFRIFAAIPILIIISLLSGGFSFSNESTTSLAGAFGGIVVIPTVLMILFQTKYPRWWFDWNLELLRFSNRVGVYMALMDDQYPSTDEHQNVKLDMPYPNVEKDLSRGLPLVKWLLAIPHWIVLIVLSFVALFVVVIAWFAILFTGRYPKGMFDFVEGVFRWSNRVYGYAILMVTDEYPPFSLEP